MKLQKQQTCQKHPNLDPSKGRPLSISSISSAASSNSSSSSNSTASSGIQSPFTRNGSLNYEHEYRKSAYLAAVENSNQHSRSATFETELQSMEVNLKNLGLSPENHSKGAANRAAVLAAGAQSRAFGSRINRSLHASLRYDKNTAYRIHLMANARNLLNNNSFSNSNHEQSPKGVSVRRNNSSTSSDSGHIEQSHHIIESICTCTTKASLTSSPSANLVDQTADCEKEPSTLVDGSKKAATLDSGSCQRSIKHDPNCFYSKISRPKRASAKLQPSPSSASSRSNTSSFRDDGFEDDFTSTTSERMSTYNLKSREPNHGRLERDVDDEYQSCEEELDTSNTTASTTSNLDDCALSTTSSSIIQQEQHTIDKITLANVKQQYRRSLLLEHQQQQHLHTQHTCQTRIQSLITTPPKISHLGIFPKQATNSSITPDASPTPPSKQLRSEDRTVNIISHMPTRSPGYWDSNLSITQRVVTEIIETERTYVDDLEQIVTGYICYLRNVLKQQKHHQSQKVDKKYQPTTNLDESLGNTANHDDAKSMIVFDDDTANDMEDYDVDDAENDLTKENLPQNNSKLSVHENTSSQGALMTANHIKKLFSNLEDIYKFNKDLLFRLEECYLNPSSVAECFVENAPGFEVYTHYCTTYPQVVSTLTELMANPESALLFKERQNELNQSLPLGTYLLKPVQRILKYHILFQSLIKHTTDDSTVDGKDRQLISEAFSVMTSIACHINTMKKRHEHAIRVQEVQGLLCGWNGPDLTTLGELILEDTFKLYNRPRSSRHLFLFDNVLLITKKKREGSLCYKGHIACSNLMLIENIEGQPLVFNTVPFDNPKALCSFQAKNIDKKRDWCVQMKEVIIKSFEVKIPVHVRDILMSLTTSSNAVTSPKPSSETSRLLRAPNYLEKRAKHDKKK